MIEIKVPEDSAIIRAVIQYLTKVDEELTGPTLFTTPTVPVSVAAADVIIRETEEDVTDDEVEPSEGALDTDGLPWDHRIHASTRSKNADGRWKLLRGVDKDVVAEIKAEYMGKSDTIPENTAPQKAEVISETPPPPPPPVESEVVTPPPPPPPSEGSKWSFVTLIEAITANNIPLEKAQATAAEFGVTRFPLLQTAEYAPKCAMIALALGLE